MQSAKKGNLRRRAAGLWMGGIAACLLLLGFQLGWRQMLWFIALSLLLFSARRRRALRALEPALAVILASGILFSVFESSADWGASAARVGALLCLTLGTLGAIAGLLFGHQKRPVGGIVDCLIFGFCFLFPLGVLALQCFVQRQFEVFPIAVGAGGWAWRLLAIFSSWIILSQWLLQDRTLVDRVRPIYLTTGMCLVAILSFRLAQFGLAIREERLEQTLAYATRLDLRSSVERLAAREAERLFEQGRISESMEILDRPLRLWWHAKQQRKRLLELTDNPALTALVAGLDAPTGISAPLTALAIEKDSGGFVFLDRKGEIYRLDASGLQSIGQVNIPDARSVPCDLLLQNENRELWVLFSGGQVAQLKPEPPTEGQPLHYRISREMPAPEASAVPARAWMAFPDGGIGIAYGDFTIRPLNGILPEWLENQNREIRPVQNLLRGISLLESGQGGYILDAYGGIHPVGESPIRYEDLREHSRQKYHYWPGRDIAASIACSPDGRQIAVFDAFGGVHCLEKNAETDEVRYFGSIRAFFQKPEAAAVQPGFGSFYFLHGSGEIDRRAGFERLFSSRLRDSFEEIGLLPLGILAILGGIVFRSPRRVPPGE